MLPMQPRDVKHHGTTRTYVLSHISQVRVPLLAGTNLGLHMSQTIMFPRQQVYGKAYDIFDTLYKIGTNRHVRLT